MARNLALKGDNTTMQNIGRWAYRHKSLANAAMLAPGIALGSGAYALGEKAIKKPMKAIDPDAYKYQEAKDKAAQQTQMPQSDEYNNYSFNNGQI